MIPPSVFTEILHRIEAAQTQHNVRVLLAVESGSRAWGFASPNSDFDVRFIYVHQPDWYHSVDLEEQRDVIEYPIVDDIDINGWDLRKALRLFWKSNPAFVEWIQSPILYLENGSFASLAREALPEVYSVESGIYHYRSMAKTNFRGYLQTNLVPLKKYFYVLRPLLSVRWLERYDQAAPIEFEKLLPLINDQPQLQQAIAKLLEQKRSTPEMGLAPKVMQINAFIESELERLETLVPAAAPRSSVIASLNDIFRNCLKQAWSR